MRSHLAVMDPREFQYFVADFFCSLGYKVQVTSGSNDGGKDIILYKGNEMKFVEVKRYTKGMLSCFNLLQWPFIWNTWHINEIIRGNIFYICQIGM